MTDQTAKGGCLCGRIRYVADGNPAWIAHCHCATCRHHVAGPVATFVGFRRDQVRFETDEPAVYLSSPNVERGFCPHCGTPLFYRSDRHPGEIHLLIGSFDTPDAFTPQFHVFVDERLPWFDVADGLPRYAETARGADPI